MSTRGVISSLAWSSESLRTPAIISASSAAKSPLSAATSRTDTSSASERARRSRSTAAENARAEKRNAKLTGFNAARQKRRNFAHVGARRSAFFIARRFGVISPKRRSPTVIAGTAAKPPQRGNADEKSV